MFEYRLFSLLRDSTKERGIKTARKGCHELTTFAAIISAVAVGSLDDKRTDKRNTNMNHSKRKILKRIRVSGKSFEKEHCMVQGLLQKDHWH